MKETIRPKDLSCQRRSYHVLLRVGEFLRELDLQRNEEVAPVAFLLALLRHALALDRNAHKEEQREERR